MIPELVFMIGPVVSSIVYGIVNMSSVATKGREFQRITEVLVLEEQLQDIIDTGNAQHLEVDEEQETLAEVLISGFRVDVISQFQNGRK